MLGTPAGYVIEGPDGGGKTYLARLLRNRLYWPVIQVVQPFEPNIEQMQALLKVGPVIFDRYHLSPVTYGDVLREGRELSEEQEDGFNILLKNAGYTLVICITAIDTMLENNRRVDQLWDEVRERDVLERLVTSYLNCATQSLGTGLRTVMWDYQSQEPEEFDNLLTC